MGLWVGGRGWNTPLMHVALNHGQLIKVVSGLLCVLLKFVIIIQNR